MKKNVLIVIISAMVLLIAVGSWYYYYYYVDTISNYFLVKYTPPQPKESFFGEPDYSAPEVKVLELKDYSSDDEALTAETQGAKSNYSYLLKEQDKELRLSQEADPMMQAAKMNALTSMLAEERYLVRITHTRKFSSVESLKMIQQHWADKSLEDFTKSNKIELAVFPISKI